MVVMTLTQVQLTLKDEIESKKHKISTKLKNKHVTAEVIACQ